MPIRIDKLSGFAAGSASLPLGRDSKKGGRLGQGEEAMAVEPNEIACDAEVRSCQHTHVLNQGPVLHGLFDPSYFHDFQRRLREEVATSQQLKAATNDSEASSGNDRQAPRVFSKDESQKTESEGEGEDIEEAEFKIADETSDEETSQDRAMIDDAPQEEENEVVRCCRMNAAMETDSEAEGFSQVLARLKRRAPGGATSPLQSRRRRRVLLSSSDSSGEEEDSPSQGRSQAVSVEHPPVPKEGGALGTDCQMLDDLSPELEDDGWSDDLPPEPEDDGWSDLFDLSLEDDFAKSCVIVPRLRWASRQTTAANGAPTALDAAGQASLEPPTSLSAPIPSAAAAQSAIRAAQQEQNTPAAAQGLGRAPNSVPAPARSATPAAPEPDVAAPRYPPPSSTSQPPPSPPIVSKGSAVQETVSPRQVPSPANMGGPSRVDPILAAAHHFHTMGVASLTFNMKVWLNDKGEEKKAPAGLMREWQNKCDLGNCLREGVRPGRGCVAIVTEPSDIYALDVDTKDGGVEAFERMLEEHGPLPDDTPWEWSGNRPGRHFFFSLSQSKAAGLLSGAGRTRLTYKGVKVGLDMRGEGGMLFVGPSSYKGSDGAVRQYEWVQEIAPDRSNLRALPPWLIEIINASDVPQAAPRIWNDGKTWWMWDGKRFKQATVERVKFVCIHQLSTVYSRLRAELKEQLSVTTDEEEKKELKRALDKVRRYYDAGEISSTLTIMTGEMALDLVGELDSNPDILNVQNGVINLRTGELDIHRPEYLCTKLADINYKGLGHSTPIVKGFLDDIFNEDRALIDFMQRLWGYAIKGRTSEEIIVFLLGSGGHPTPIVKGFLDDIFNEDRALIDFMQRLWGYAINGRTSEEIIVFLLGSGGMSFPPLAPIVFVQLLLFFFRPCLSTEINGANVS
ncbi:hypothetical protein KFL_002480195 [Klebsormidium nitens]|uniref:DNA primase/polymerase bifunctional N-terminal domain-containing protein n=1 Tax=Klebsormidium nitens TaxID=105231 RepID=A0A1Y1I6X1_KLENI|nr:hypothetical protein KFL_002480195 [Klebsormidium nitens]|eukprot:GAQ85682.1 hypothetical protein KFL_002480195 [Klebsormidium nitens]